MKYDVIVIELITLATGNVNGYSEEQNKKSGVDLYKAISEGYEITSAVSCGNSLIGKILYILRREIVKK